MVLCPQPVEMERRSARALKYDADVPAHRRRRHIQLSTESRFARRPSGRGWPHDGSRHSDTTAMRATIADGVPTRSQIPTDRRHLHSSHPLPACTRRLRSRARGRCAHAGVIGLFSGFAAPNTGRRGRSITLDRDGFRVEWTRCRAVPIEPSRLNLLPWHRQLIVPSCTTDTVQAASVPMADNPLSTPAEGGSARCHR